MQYSQSIPREGGIEVNSEQVCVNGEGAEYTRRGMIEGQMLLRDA